MHALSKSISLSSRWCSSAPLASRDNVRFVSGAFGTQPDNLFFLADTNPFGVRIVIDLVQFWPTQNVITPGLLEDLDQQIAAARAAGRSVFLAFEPTFPSWLNNNTAPEPVTNKDASLKLPDDVGQFSLWFWVLLFFLERYRMNRPGGAPVNGFAWVNAIEISNQPNHRNWQEGEGGAIAARKIADMMKTAKWAAATVGNAVVVTGPGLLDVSKTSAEQTNFLEFTSLILTRLHANGFFTPAEGNNHIFLWTHHNYHDVLFDIGPDSTHPDSAHHRDCNALLLVDALDGGGWRGFPDGVGGPAAVFITEGGADLTRIAAADTWGPLTIPQAQTKQAFLLGRSWARMKSDTQGRGVFIMTQHQFYSSAAVDSGLVDDAVPPVLRPAYSTWKLLS